MTSSRAQRSRSSCRRSTRRTTLTACWLDITSHLPSQPMIRNSSSSVRITFLNSGSAIRGDEDPLGSFMSQSPKALETERTPLINLPELRVDLRSLDATPDFPEESNIVEFIPSIRSGSFADIGPRNYMEDEHIRIDNLSGHLGSVFTCPTPSAFYGGFDGHGGQDAEAYIKRHATQLFFKAAEFQRASEADNVFLESVENSVRKAFLQADLAFADDCTVSTSSGTTALTALIL